MTTFDPLRSSKMTMGAAIALAAFALLGAPAHAEPGPPQCTAASDLVRFDRPLSRIAERIALGEPIKIVAIGSSSTSGPGASSAAWTYPSRLEVELKNRFPRLVIRVLNRGVNGEEVPQMLARFTDAVIAEKPDLVIWQAGTNAVLRGHDIQQAAAGIHEGLVRLKALGVDVILMDLQFAPQVIAKPDADTMVKLISTAAKRDNVDLFQRFAVMRDWSLARRISFRQSLSPDGLHLNDWSYACVAKLLASSIAEAATRAPLTAGIRQTSTAQQ